MSNAVVSIIEPVYNMKDYLAYCIDSILGQTYTELDIVLVDDGSTDDSLEICRKYQRMDSRIRVLHQNNKGVSAARNLGLDAATGDYVAFVDSDDELCLNAVEILLNCLKKNQGDIATGKRIIVPNDEIKKEEDSQQDAQIICGEDSRKLAVTAVSQSVWGKIFKKDVIRDIRFEPGRNINEDGFFMFQCYLKAPTIINCGSYVYKYRNREGSVSRSVFSEKYFDMLFFLEKKKEIINSDYPSLRNGISLIEIRTQMSFLGVLCRTNDKRYRKYEKNSIREVKKNYKSIDPRLLTDYEKKLSQIIYYNLYPAFKQYVLLKYYKKHRENDIEA